MGRAGEDRRVSQHPPVVRLQYIEAAVLAADSDHFDRSAFHRNRVDFGRVANRLIFIPALTWVVAAHAHRPDIAGVDLRAPALFAIVNIESNHRAGLASIRSRIVVGRPARRVVGIGAKENHAGPRVVRRRTPDGAR